MNAVPVMILVLLHLANTLISCALGEATVNAVNVNAATQRRSNTMENSVNSALYVMFQ